MKEVNYAGDELEQVVSQEEELVDFVSKSPGETPNEGR